MAILLAARNKISDLLQNRDFLIISGILLVTLLAGAVILSWLQRWRKRQFEESHKAEDLTSFRAMYERGELSPEEYAKIRQRVADRIKAKPAPDASRSISPTSEKPAEPSGGASESSHPQD